MSRRMKVLDTNCFLYGDMLNKARELGLKRNYRNQVRIICGCTSMANANRKCEALGLGHRVFTSGYTTETGNEKELSLAMDGSVWVLLDSGYVNVTELNGGVGIKDANSRQ